MSAFLSAEKEVAEQTFGFLKVLGYLAALAIRDLFDYDSLFSKMGDDKRTESIWKYCCLSVEVRPIFNFDWLDCQLMVLTSH